MCRWCSYGLVGGFFGWGKFSDGNVRSLLFVYLSQGHGPGWGFVAAATSGFVEAEGLERSGKGKEKQRGSNEDTKVEMGHACVLKKGPRESHFFFCTQIA